MLLLRQLQAFLCELLRLLHLSSDLMEVAQSHQDRHELTRLPDEAAEVVGAAVGSSNLGSPHAFGVHPHLAEDGLYRELLSAPIQGVRKTLKHLQTSGEM